MNIFAIINTATNLVENVVCDYPADLTPGQNAVLLKSGMGMIYPGDKYDSETGTFEKEAIEHKVESGEIEPEVTNKTVSEVAEKPIQDRSTQLKQRQIEQWKRQFGEDLFNESFPEYANGIEASLSREEENARLMELRKKLIKLNDNQ